MYDETVQDFLVEADGKLSDIEKFKNAQDMPNYAILVHSLKSDSKYLGMMDLADIAYKHEMASKENNVDFVNSNYDELMKLAKEKVEMLKKYIGN
ncbi:MAG: Hpt domain-containing protein [Bacilli bacterium]|nr:Hpt domain-containing protein [Bacilli bacterium]